MSCCTIGIERTALPRPSTPARKKTVTTRQVRAQIQRLEKWIDGLRMIPATRIYRGKVVLALFSKALTLGRAICSLIDKGFPAEAFGLARTLVDVSLYLRYMRNKDTDARITAYVEYWSRVHQEWGAILAKHYPQNKVKHPWFHDEVMRMAKKFKSKHQWQHPCCPCIHRQLFDAPTPSVNRRG
jgi:hypothetical protein